ncbi:hypothetical protein [Haloferula luteola]|nr:hypothetical protein [Haloferula luteola]
MSDLHRGNIMLDHDENPTVIDALVGSVSERHVRNLPLIQNAFDHAQALRFGRKYEDPSVLRLPPDEEL